MALVTREKKKTVMRSRWGGCRTPLTRTRFECGLVYRDEEWAAEWFRELPGRFDPVEPREIESRLILGHFVILRKFQRTPLAVKARYSFNCLLRPRAALF